MGGRAAAWHAGHRASFDRDHVLADLRDRFDAVLDAIERTDGWVTNRVTPGKVIPGELGGIEAGVRQMIRTRPLEVVEVALPSGRTVRVPTLDEILRVKAFLIVRRNQTRDYLDVAALAERAGADHAARVLAGIDAYYADQRGIGDGVASQVARRLEGALAASRPYGAAPLMERVLTHARRDAEAGERAEVAARVRAHLEASGLGRAAFAAAIGTSPSRLSTYLSGRVAPSSTLLVRMERVARAAAAAHRAAS